MPLIRAAIDAIAALIVEEAVELPNDTGEIWDISSLLCALQALREFWWSESDSGEVPSPNAEDMEVETVEMTTIATLVKNASADDASDEDKESLTILVKAIADAVQSDQQLVTTTELEAATEALEGRLATVEKMAAPTGPVKARTEAQLTKAGERELLISEAEQLEHLAEMAAGADNVLAEGYRQNARKARSVAASLV